MATEKKLRGHVAINLIVGLRTFAHGIGGTSAKYQALIFQYYTPILPPTFSNMEHSPPPYLTSKHRELFEAMLLGMYTNSTLVNDPSYWVYRNRILAILKPKLEVLHNASAPEASAEQLLAAFHHVCATMA